MKQLLLSQVARKPLLEHMRLAKLVAQSDQSLHYLHGAFMFLRLYKESKPISLSYQADAQADVCPIYPNTGLLATPASDKA